MIGSVYLWESDVVMVLALDGTKLPEYDGPLNAAQLDHLRRHTPSGAAFYTGVWGGSILPVARAVWFAQAEERLQQEELARDLAGLP